PCHHQRVHGLVCRVTGGQSRRVIESWPPAFVTLIRGSAAASAKTSGNIRAIEFPLLLAVTNSPFRLDAAPRLLTRAVLSSQLVDAPRLPTRAALSSQISSV